MVISGGGGESPPLLLLQPKKILLLLKRLRAFQLFHILCNLNKQADEEENIGATLSKGEIQINGISSRLAIP
jgi:hypothetical protein